MPRLAESRRRHATPPASPAACAACRTGHRLAVHRADDRAAARDQHLPADLDDPALVHQLPRQPAQRADRLESACDNYERVLTDPDIWDNMQVTAHFVFWTIALQTLLGFGAGLLINQRSAATASGPPSILLPMMLSPAVVGNFWTFLYQPQIGLFNYVVAFFTGVDPTSFQMIGDVDAGALGHRPRRHLDVDALRHADLPRRPALDPRLHLRGGRGRPRLAVAAVLVDHPADGAALPHAGGAVPRASRTSRCSTWSIS